MNQNRMAPFLVALAAALLWVPLLTAGTVISVGSNSVSGFRTFGVPVRITNASDVYAFQFDLHFNPFIVRLLGMSEGGFLPSAGSTIFSAGSIDNGAGIASATADTLIGLIPGASGNGVLADLTFQSIDGGVSDLILSGVILLDSNLDSIPFTATPGSVIVAVPEPPGLPWVGGLTLAGMLWRKRRSGVAQGERRTV